MKANEAPEKIILSADRETGTLYDEWVIRDLTDNIKIEYVRYDAFIEKACEWLKENLAKETSVIGNGNVTIKFKGAIEAFKKAMEE